MEYVCTYNCHDCNENFQKEEILFSLDGKEAGTASDTLIGSTHFFPYLPNSVIATQFPGLVTSSIMGPRLTQG